MSQPRRELPKDTAGFESAAKFSDAFVGSMQNIFKAMTGLQQEYLSFATHRLEKNAEAASEFLRCKSWEDVAACQQAWAKDASEEYAQHITRLTELTQAALPNGVSSDESSKRAN